MHTFSLSNYTVCLTVNQCLGLCTDYAGGVGYEVINSLHFSHFQNHRSIKLTNVREVYKSNCVVREPWLLTQLYKQADPVRDGILSAGVGVEFCRSFRRRSSQPITWVILTNHYQTMHNDTLNTTSKKQSMQNTAKQNYPFSRLLQRSTLKRDRHIILVSRHRASCLVITVKLTISYVLDLQLTWLELIHNMIPRQKIVQTWSTAVCPLYVCTATNVHVHLHEI